MLHHLTFIYDNGSVVQAKAISFPNNFNRFCLSQRRRLHFHEFTFPLLTQQQQQNILINFLVLYLITMHVN